DLRLIVNRELAQLQPASQLALELHQITPLVCHVGTEHLTAATAASLCRIHRDVGTPDELLAGAGPAGVHRDADARIEHEVVGCDGHRIAEPFEQSMGDLEGYRLAGTVEQQRELVSAEAREGVAGPYDLAEPLRQLLEQAV